MKLNVSKVDRNDLTSLVPSVGSLDEVIKYNEWLEQIKYSPEEYKKLEEFNKISDHSERDQAVSDWHHTKSEIEISDDFFKFLVDKIRAIDSSKGIATNDNYKLYQYLLSLNV